MQLIHTEIEQTTKIRLNIELGERDLQLLCKLFQADQTIPETLREKDYIPEDEVEELGELMADIYEPLYNLRLSLGIGR